MVRIEERITLVDWSAGEQRLIRPDLLIEKGSDYSQGGGGATVLEVEPTTIPLLIVEEVKEHFIEILHRPDRSLVTVIELLSPDNKTGSGLASYLSKRNAILKGSVHLVELDLLMGGQRLPLSRPLPRGDVYALVARGDRRPDCEVYAWSIRQRLSSIRLPLLAPDPDLKLDLAAIYAIAFAKGRYARSIDYSAPLTTHLDPEDRAWAEEQAHLPQQ